MSVVIIGGNECMVRQYKDLCQEYSCDAKVFPEQQFKGNRKSGSYGLVYRYRIPQNGKKCIE